MRTHLEVFKLSGRLAVVPTGKCVGQKQVGKSDALVARGVKGEDEESEVSRLRRENQELKRENELLKMQK